MTSLVLFLSFVQTLLKSFDDFLIFTLQLQFLMDLLDDLLGPASRHTGSYYLFESFQCFVFGWLIKLEFLFLFYFLNLLCVFCLNHLHFLFFLLQLLQQLVDFLLFTFALLDQVNRVLL